MKKSIYYFRFFLFFYLCLAIVYGPVLITYVNSGDDLFSIADATKSFPQLIRQFTSPSGGYRPVGNVFFNIYHFLVPHSTVIFFVNLGFVALSQTLLFLFLKKIISTKIALVITFVLYLSPIYYYHIFTISGTNNILILLTGFSLLQFIEFNKNKPHKRKIIIASLITVFSIFVKETFMINMLLLLIVVYQNANKKIFFSYIAGTFCALGFYTLLRIRYFVPADPNYSFVYTPAKLLENFGLMVSWLLQFPRGWQYGAPLPKTIITYFVSGSFFSITGIFLAILLLKKKMYLLFLGLLGFFALVPYFFLNRILVYYLDIAMVIYIVAFIFAISTLSKRSQNILTAIISFLFIIHFLSIYPQWHRYSFVANANETAKNYILALKKANAENYDTVCILNHNKGAWATQNGELASYVYDNKFKIISTLDLTISNECTNNSLVLINDERSYKKLIK